MTGLPVLCLEFRDFWPGFDPTDNWFTRLLATRYDVKMSGNADVLIFSCYGSDYRSFTGKRVFFSGENRAWGFSKCDWAFTPDVDRHPRHCRLPLWVLELEQPFVQPAVDAEKELAEKQGFASVVVSNAASPTRNRIHDLLETYRNVSSGGRFRNNVGGPVPDKLEFISRYKFNLTFENSTHRGYSTEKLLQALQANTVPLYWGDPIVAEDFNPNRFLDLRSFKSDEAFLQRVIKLDQDDDSYCEMLREPWFRDGRLPICANLEAILDRFDSIVSWSGTPIARQSAVRTFPLRVADRIRAHQRYRGRVT